MRHGRNYTDIRRESEFSVPVVPVPRSLSEWFDDAVGVSWHDNNDGTFVLKIIRDL